MTLKSTVLFVCFVLLLAKIMGGSYFFCFSSRLNPTSHLNSKQKIPSRQQNSAKKGSERYLMFGPNHILLTLRWDDGHSRSHENACQWFLNRLK